MRPTHVVQCLLVTPIPVNPLGGMTYQRVFLDADKCPRVGKWVSLTDDERPGRRWKVVEKDTVVVLTSSIHHDWHNNI
jgi:hypothetical protein